MKLGKERIIIENSQETIGTICNGVSMHAVWEEIARSDMPWAVVMEDDFAITSPEEYDLLVSAVNRLEDPWERQNTTKT